jgi:integrase
MVLREPLKFIRDLEVAERPFLWLQSAGEVQKLLAACNDNIGTLVAVLVGTGMRLDEALHLMWTDVDLQHRVIHVHRGRRGAPKSGRLRHVPIFDSVLTVLREMKLAKGKNTLLWPGAKLDKFDEQLPRNKTSVFRPFKAAVLRAGLSKKLRLHDLRHRPALVGQARLDRVREWNAGRDRSGHGQWHVRQRRAQWADSNSTAEPRPAAPDTHATP